MKRNEINVRETFKMLGPDIESIQVSFSNRRKPKIAAVRKESWLEFYLRNRR